MKSLNLFQIILIAVFILFALIATFIFSGAIKIRDKGEVAGLEGTVTIWGTLNGPAVMNLLNAFNQEARIFSVNYVQKNPETFRTELLEAIASQTGPDSMLLPSDLIYRFRDVVFQLPFESFPVRTFKNSYAEASEILITKDGVMGLPLTVDPMILYFNRALLNNAGISEVPENWDEVVEDIPLLTKVTGVGEITESAIALGTFDNITNGKDIISLLFLQTENPIVSETDLGFDSTLSKSFLGQNRKPSDEIIQFYTNFANPASPQYSWNLAEPRSQDAFILGDLAFYLGFASELPQISARNPNLNFDIANVPQLSGSRKVTTFSRFNSLVVSKHSGNSTTAIVAMGMLANGDFASQLSSLLALPPVRRDLLKTPPADTSWWPIFYDASLQGRSWLDPSPDETREIWRTMVRDITSGRSSVNEAVLDAHGKLDIVLDK